MDNMQQYGDFIDLDSLILYKHLAYITSSNTVIVALLFIAFCNTLCIVPR